MSQPRLSRRGDRRQRATERTSPLTKIGQSIFKHKETTGYVAEGEIQESEKTLG